MQGPCEGRFEVTRSHTRARRGRPERTLPLSLLLSGRLGGGGGLGGGSGLGGGGGLGGGSGLGVGLLLFDLGGEERAVHPRRARVGIANGRAVTPLGARLAFMLYYLVRSQARSARRRSQHHSLAFRTRIRVCTCVCRISPHYAMIRVPVLYSIQNAEILTYTLQRVVCI